MGPLREDERDGILDAIGLIEAEARGDQLATSVILFATDDPASLRRLAATLSFLLARVEDADNPETLAAVRRRFVGQATTP